jgi:hypothetical protein
MALVKEYIDYDREDRQELELIKILEIGLLKKVREYAKEKGWDSPEEWIPNILNDPQLGEETRDFWVQALLNHGHFKSGVVRESLDFERGLTPKQSLGIGIEETIRNFLDDKTSSSPSLWISYLLNEGREEELDRETRDKWIKFLITKPEYNKDLDENDYLELAYREIEWIPYAPFKDDNFKYKFTENSYVLYFKDWGNFADYFDTTSRDVNSQFIEAVLSGDGSYEYFDYGVREYKDITDFAWPINRVLQKGKQIPAIKDLKDKAIEMGADPNKTETIDDLLEEIQENEDLSDLCDAVRFAYSEATALADESEAYMDLQRAIKKHYHIGDAKYDESKEFFVAPCDFEGIKLLSFTLATGEDKIEYNPPQSYSGDMTMEDINDSLINKLDDLE